MIPFVGGSNQLRRKKADTQRTVNMYPSFIESGSGKARMFLKSIPGLREFSTVPAPCIPASIDSFSATEGDAGYLLEWSVIGDFTTLTLSDGTTDTDVTGLTSLVVDPSETTTYTLTATGGDCGDATDDVVVTLPPGGGYYGSTSGEGGSPTLPEGLISGDGLLLFIHHESHNITPTFDVPGWGTNIANREDSSTSVGWSIFARTADGTPADALMDFSMPSGQQTSWIVVGVHGLTDPSFPSSMVGAGTNYIFNNATDPANCVVVGASGNLFAITGFQMCSPTVGGATITGIPSGFTQAQSVSFDGVTPYSGPLFSCTATQTVCYQEIVGTSVNPTSFADGSGSYAGGGYGSLTMLVRYTP